MDSPRFIGWFAVRCWALVFVIILTGCSATQMSAAIHTDPTARFEAMRQLELNGDYTALAKSMTDRGRGWLCWEICKGLLVQAYEEGHDENLGTGAGDLLDKYHLDHLAAAFPEWVLADGQDRAQDRLLQLLDKKWSAFLADCRNLRGAPFFPGDWQITAQNSPSRITTELKVAEGEESLRVRFVRRGGKWLFDGGG